MRMLVVWAGTRTMIAIDIMRRRGVLVIGMISSGWRLLELGRLI